MRDIINEFRGNSGVSQVAHWDSLICDYCGFHNLAMSKERRIFHAPEHCLNEWKEVVAVCTYNGEGYREIQRKLIFEVLAQSEGHRNILLGCSTLAFAFYINDYTAYLTIRGK